MDKNDINILEVAEVPDPVAVKELFGLMLDAAEAEEFDETRSDESKDAAKVALEKATSAVRLAAENLLEAHHRADTGLFCEPKSLTDQQMMAD